MSSVTLSGRGTLGDRQVYRLGYGAMQLVTPVSSARPKILKKRCAYYRPPSRPG